MLQDILTIFKNSSKSRSGFVLPFTLLICAIMILLSVGISSILIKQIHFSNIGRESQLAYYAADNALACTLMVEETYSYNGAGIFPSDPNITYTSANLENMETVVDSVNNLRAQIEPPLTPLASNLSEIRCAQSEIFNTQANLSNFETSAFTRTVEGSSTPELGVSSSFMLRIKINDDTYRCAKVTFNKTATYKQIIAQGYPRCDRQVGSIERAVIYSTVQ